MAMERIWTLLQEQHTCQGDRWRVMVGSWRARGYPGQRPAEDGGRGADRDMVMSDLVGSAHAVEVPRQQARATEAATGVASAYTECRSRLEGERICGAR